MSMVLQLWLLLAGSVAGVLGLGCNEGQGSGREVVRAGLSAAGAAALSPQPPAEPAAGALAVCERAESVQFDRVSSKALAGVRVADRDRERTQPRLQ
jgi:hypothetical protein